MNASDEETKVGEPVARSRGLPPFRGRRRPPLPSGAIVLSMLMVTAAFLFVSAPQSVLADSATPCQGSVSVSVTSTTTTATDVTLQWHVNAPTWPATVSMWWGNTTNYGFTAFSGKSVSSSSTQTTYINYLQPSTTYYYKFQAWAGGYCSYPSTGTWGTGASSTSTISGTIYDAQSGATGPQSLIVEAWCAHNPSGPYVWSYTNGQGQYSFSVSSLNCGQYGSGGAAAYDVVMGEATPGYWTGHWNETMVVWAPQVVNFYLERNFIGPYVPVTLDFTDSSYATLSYNYTVGVTTTYTFEVAGNGGQSSSTFSQSEYGSSTGSSLEDWVQYYTTGMIEFNAIASRASSVLTSKFYGAIQSSTTQNLASDPISPSSVSAAQCYGNGLWYSYTITSQQTRGGSVTISGSTTFTTGLNLDVSVSFDIPGSGVSVGASVPIQYGVSSTQSYSNSFYFSVHNTDTANHVFRAYVQGGSSTTAGVVMHVWQLS